MSVSAVTATASDIQMDYMKLLVTELRNQNPLEPLDNREMASQLAQFSQLQQLENLNASFTDALATAQRSYANSLIGKEISFVTDSSGGNRTLAEAVVEQVSTDSQGQVVLVAGDNLVSLQDIVSVRN